jgi:hypothetical protein
MKFVQDSGGSRTIGTYQSDYLGSTAPPLSTLGGAKDLAGYVTDDASKIWFGSPVNNGH